MDVIYAQNVNDAFRKGIELLRKSGQPAKTRAGEVLVLSGPVTTVYEFPQQRVLFDPVRDANPFFHLMESLWMLAGRRDARWLDQFVKDFSKRFAEDDGLQHGAYGFRWRYHFDIEGGGHPSLPDQIAAAIRLLKKNPDDRRVVISMWDPVADLGADKRDIPCNTHIYLRIRTETGEPEPYGGEPLIRQCLDITVCCRSNDAIWGAYGANAVHFSFLQEYLAAQLGVGIGRYYQVSNNFHAYVEVLDKQRAKPGYDYSKFLVMGICDLVIDPEIFDEELRCFMLDPEWSRYRDYKNRFFPLVAIPLFSAYKLFREKRVKEAYDLMGERGSNDWLFAARQWLKRRMK